MDLAHRLGLRAVAEGAYSVRTLEALEAWMLRREQPPAPEAAVLPRLEVA